MASPEAAKWKEAMKSDLVLRRWDVNGSSRRRHTWMGKYTLIKLGFLRRQTHLDLVCSYRVAAGLQNVRLIICSHLGSCLV
ncbi:hypothetical protein Tco_1366546 [Tanacetum coccineum]